MADQGAIGKYRPLEPVGSGGFAVVYRALDTVLEREVALKVLKPQYLGDPEFVERFFHEARVVARLDHPAIVRIFDVASADGRAFIAMELAADSLAGLIARRGPLPWDEALALLQPLCEALDYAHGAGLVHRDLKPANVLLGRRGQPMISDFGFARATADRSSSLSLGGGVLGTPGYIAPEIWDGGDGGQPADRYALACIAYELLTGQVLFRADTPARAVTAHVVEGPRFPERWPPGVPPGVAEVLGRALRRDPAGRFPSAAAFFAALTGLGRQQAAVPPPDPAPPPPDPAPPDPGPPPGPSRRGLFAQIGGQGCTFAVTLALLLAVGGLALFGGQVNGVFSTIGSQLGPPSTVALVTDEPISATTAAATPTPAAEPPAPTTTVLAATPPPAATAAPFPVATIAPSPTPYWTPEPAEVGQLLEGGGEGALFRAASRDRAVTPAEIPDTPSCVQGLIVGADGVPARHFRVEVASGSDVRRADHDHLSGTYAICGLEPGSWSVSVAEYLHNPISAEERAAHAVPFRTSGAPGEIFYITFQARAPIAPAATPFPPPVADPGEPERYDGRWEGQLSGSSPAGPVSAPFAFEVRDGRVAFTASAAAPCPWGDPDLRATIAGGFSFAGLAAGDGVYYELAGVFTADDEAAGTLAADVGGSPCLTGATWTAARVAGR